MAIRPRGRKRSLSKKVSSYTHATNEAKRRAVENLVKFNGPSDESVTNQKDRVGTLP